MEQEGLISSYTVAQFRPQKDKCNDSKTANLVDRQFKEQPYRNIVVSDLTYVRLYMKGNAIKHKLVDILTIGLFSVFCNGDAISEMELFGETH